MLVNRAALLASCLICLNAATAMGVQYDQNIYVFHEGSNDPVTESTLWTLNPGVNPLTVSSGPGNETISAVNYNYWHTTDNGTAANNFLSYSETISASQALNPWTYRTRMRSVGTTLTDQMFALYDGTHRWGVWIRDDRLLNSNSGQTLLTTTNLTADYRELELLYKPITPGVTNAADLLEVYLDQSLVASFTRSSALVSAVASSIHFGGNSSAGTGRVNWNRIEFVQGAIVGFAQELPPAPEPGSLSLLALGSLALCKWGKRGSRSAA